jgi:plastocyanin
MMWMMAWMVLFWAAVGGAVVWLASRGRAGTRGLALAVAAVAGLAVLIPVVAMAAGGWDMDMWDMHGRGRNTSGEPLVRGGPQADVHIEDFTFAPGNLEVPVGATVTWTNEDSAPHDARARTGGWRTERLSEYESDSVTFDAPGDYDYYCSIHPSMRARLVVR